MEGLSTIRVRRDLQDDNIVLCYVDLCSTYDDFIAEIFVELQEELGISEHITKLFRLVDGRIHGEIKRCSYLKKFCEQYPESIFTVTTIPNPATGNAEPRLVRPMSESGFRYEYTFNRTVLAGTANLLKKRKQDKISISPCPSFKEYAPTSHVFSNASLLSLILSFLPIKDALRLRQINHCTNDIVASSTARLVKTIHIRGESLLTESQSILGRRINAIFPNVENIVFWYGTGRHLSQNLVPPFFTRFRVGKGRDAGATILSFWANSHRQPEQYPIDFLRAFPDLHYTFCVLKGNTCSTCGNEPTNRFVLPVCNACNATVPAQQLNSTDTKTQDPKPWYYGTSKGIFLAGRKRWEMTCNHCNTRNAFIVPCCKGCKGRVKRSALPYYCNEECATKHWYDGHSSICKVFR